MKWWLLLRVSKKKVKKSGIPCKRVDASKLTQAREADPMSALKGNAAGLQIDINQEIGHAPNVIIRGENAPTDRPMFVVDGVPITSDTYNINSDDIDTYTILKGPNAAALYGFQGRNGAIIINTKKGTRIKEDLLSLLIIRPNGIRVFWHFRYTRIRMVLGIMENTLLAVVVPVPIHILEMVRSVLA